MFVTNIGSPFSPVSVQTLPVFGEHCPLGGQDLQMPPAFFPSRGGPATWMPREKLVSAQGQDPGGRRPGGRLSKAVLSGLRGPGAPRLPELHASTLGPRPGFQIRGGWLKLDSKCVLLSLRGFLEIGRFPPKLQIS